MNPRRRKRRDGLLVQHLEGMSWQVFEEYPTLLRDLIRGRHGVYALFRRNKLYYVGLATNLMARLKNHLRDRHRKSWDRFSVYLTASSSHMRELESLLIRIADPVGNKTGGRFAASESLYPKFSRSVAEFDEDRRARLLGGYVAARHEKKKTTHAVGSAALHGLDRRTLHARFKGHLFRATLRRDGKIRFKGKLYPSPSAAGAAVIERTCNGWTFWHYKKGREWVPLETLRK